MMSPVDVWYKQLTAKQLNANCQLYAHFALLQLPNAFPAVLFVIGVFSWWLLIHSFWSELTSTVVIFLLSYCSLHPIQSLVNPPCWPPMSFLLLVVIQGIARSMMKEDNVYQIFIISAVAVFHFLVAHDEDRILQKQSSNILTPEQVGVTCPHDISIACWIAPSWLLPAMKIKTEKVSCDTMWHVTPMKTKILVRMSIQMFIGLSLSQDRFSKNCKKTSSSIFLHCRSEKHKKPEARFRRA